MISVVMPVYNVQDYVGVAVKSILRQTYTNFELIIVNDGSTDNTLNKVSQFNDRRIKIYTTSNRGLAAARNFGLKIATGKYIYFIDSDDAIARNLLQICIEQIEQKNNDMVCFGFDRVEKIDETNIINSKLINSEYLNTKSALHQLMTEKIYQMAWSYFCKRKLFSENNILYPKGRLFEDNNTAAKLIAASSGVVKLNLNPSGYLSRKRAGSITDIATKQHTFKEFKDFQYVYEDEYQVLIAALGKNDDVTNHWYFKQLVLLYVYYKHPTIDQHPDSMKKLRDQINTMYKSRNFRIDIKTFLQYLRVKYDVFDTLVRFVKE